MRDKKYWYFAFHPCGSFSMFTGPPTEGGYACLDAAVCPLDELWSFSQRKIYVDVTNCEGVFLRLQCLF